MERHTTCPIEASGAGQVPLPESEENLSLSRQIARRLSRWYPWVGGDDLNSYAFLGLALAGRSYEPDRGVPFKQYAAQKGLFLAIDEMRRDGVLKRKRDKPMRTEQSLTYEVSDPSSGRRQRHLEARDTCAFLLGRLPKRDRRLMMMYYGDRLTFREIAEVMGVSESAVCLRHKAVLQKLRAYASTRQLA